MFVCLTATKTPDRDGVWRTMRADIASTAAECFPVDCQPLYHALLVALFDGGCEGERGRTCATSHAHILLVRMRSFCELVG